MKNGRAFRLCAALLAVFACLGTAAGAAAQGQKEAAPPQAAAQTPAQPWLINCSNTGENGKLVCQMSQTLLAGESGQRILAAVIVRPAGKTGLAMTLALPHGLNLPSGVAVWVDQAARQQFPIETADQNGSYATIDLSDDRQSAMKKGQLLNVAVKAVGGKELVMQLSLKGFSTAIDQM